MFLNEHMLSEIVKQHYKIADKNLFIINSCIGILVASTKVQSE